MRLKICALAVLALGASGLAQASASYSANFTLSGYHLPPLATGNGGLDDANPPGSWTQGATRNAWVSTADLLPSLPGSEGTPNWGNAQYGQGMHNSGGVPNQFGEIHAMVYSSSQTYGTAYVNPTSIGSAIYLQSAAGRGSAESSWTRGFSLNAHSSFTFSGTAALNITDALNAPLNASSSYSINADQSFASLTLADAADRVRTSISASIFGLTGVGTGIFSYATGPNGLLSLTVTNPYDTAITGTLQAGTHIDVLSLPNGSLSLASPVPEPATYATMILGLGIVGALARRKAKASSTPSLAS